VKGATGTVDTKQWSAVTAWITMETASTTFLVIRAVHPLMMTAKRERQSAATAGLNEVNSVMMEILSVEMVAAQPAR
jgi:hypothetical protein